MAKIINIFLFLLLLVSPFVTTQALAEGNSKFDGYYVGFKAKWSQLESRTESIENNGYDNCDRATNLLCVAVNDDSAYYAGIVLGKNYIFKDKYLLGIEFESSDVNWPNGKLKTSSNKLDVDPLDTLTEVQFYHVSLLKANFGYELSNNWLIYGQAGLGFMKIRYFYADYDNGILDVLHSFERTRIERVNVLALGAEYKFYNNLGLRIEVEKVGYFDKDVVTTLNYSSPTIYRYSHAKEQMISPSIALIYNF